jgi:peptide/nickel transport system permease protein
LIRRHILPATSETLLVQMAVDVAAVALVISGLSFVGVGVQPPQPEWGAMIADGRGYFQSAPWVVIFPGLAIVITAISFNLAGDLVRTVSKERAAAVGRVP